MWASCIIKNRQPVAAAAAEFEGEKGSAQRQKQRAEAGAEVERERDRKRERKKERESRQIVWPWQLVERGAASTVVQPSCLSLPHSLSLSPLPAHPSPCSRILNHLCEWGVRSGGSSSSFALT